MLRSPGNQRDHVAASASSPGLLRRVNAEALLGALRESDAVTVTELMARTGLTRSTTLSICDELIRAGWALELENQREAGGYVKGRPARRFLLNRHAGYVLGMWYFITPVIYPIEKIPSSYRFLAELNPVTAPI